MILSFATSPASIFPISSTDDAYAFDSNPSHIAPHDVNLTFPAVPQVAAAPTCLRYGATGISLTGAAIYHGASTGGSDAAALRTLLLRCERDAAFLNDLRAGCEAVRPLIAPAAERAAWAGLLAELGEV